jgi:hypothetical protein
MASAAITALARNAQAARNTLANMREKAKVQEERLYTVGEVALGALAGGFVDGYWQKPEVAGMPLVPVLGAVMALGGLSGVVPGGAHASAIGVGLLAGPLYAKAAEKGAESGAQ